MFRKNAVIEADDDYLVKHVLIRKKFRAACKSYKYTWDVLKDSCIELKRKKASIVLNGEEINIKMLTLPKVKGEILYCLIKNELTYTFKDIESIVFNYVIYKNNKHKIDVLVFCVQNRAINTIKKCLNSNIKIKGIYLIQFCFMDYFKLSIKEKNFLFVFAYREKLYLLYCIENKVLNSNVCKIPSEGIEFSNIMYNFMENSKMLYEINVSRIYLANCSNMELLVDRFDNVSCEKIGDVSEEELVISVAAKRS